jgi:hypothetical protein
MRFPQSVDDGFSEVVVCGGVTIFPATGIEKLPIIKFSMSGYASRKRDRRFSDDVGSLDVVELFEVEEGGGRCTRCKHFPLTSAEIKQRKIEIKC